MAFIRTRSNKLKQKNSYLVILCHTSIVNDDNEDQVNTVDVTIEVINPEDEPTPSPNNMAFDT